jgi:hypothetical protein
MTDKTDMPIPEPFDDDQPELVEFDHSPLFVPRREHHGEQVFAELWKALMEREPGEWSTAMANHMLCDVLRWRDDEVTQRAASVAATFVKWLGTACGGSFMFDCERLAAQHPGSGHGYLMAWAVENERKSWLNGGFRAIEHILAGPDDYTGAALSCLRHAPALSVDDYEVVEAVVYWLSSTDGLEFVAQCKAEMAKRELADKVAAAVTLRDYGRLKYLLREPA